jgi:hypothetical protein
MTTKKNSNKNSSPWYSVYNERSGTCYFVSDDQAGSYVGATDLQ